MESLKLIFLLLILFTISSCGSNSTRGTATLEISHAFAVTDGSFAGGFFVHGFNIDSKEEFSLAIPGGNQGVIDIPFGRWNIRAVGWDEGAMLASTVRCGETLFNFTEFNPNLAIDVSESVCRNSRSFAGVDFAETVSNPIFRNLHIYTCNNLTSPSAPVSTLANTTCPATSATSTTRSVKVSFLGGAPGLPPLGGISSSCVDISTFNTPAVMNINIPTRMPVNVALYSGLGCSSSLITNYHFPGGLESTYSFKHSFGLDSTSPPTFHILVLPDQKISRN